MIGAGLDKTEVRRQRSSWNLDASSHAVCCLVIEFPKSPFKIWRSGALKNGTVVGSKPVMG